MANSIKNVKMADIASALGVSTVAVSKALADQKGVSEDLRERVKQLARDMGYQAPARKRHGAREDGYNIGVLIPERYLDSNETFYWKLYQEVTARAMQKECFVLLDLLSDADAAQHRFTKLVTENKADGLIILGKPTHGYASALKAAWKRPVVFLDFYDSDVDADSVISNSFYGAYALTKYLIEKGHTNIGYVGTLQATDSITDRYYGYAKALYENGIPLRSEWVIDDREMETGSILQMAFPSVMPTAFVCNCDFMASVLIRQLRERGLRVPDDISVAGFDNYLYPGLCDIGITSYAVDIRDMARCAVRVMLKRLSGESHKPGMQITDGYLVEKESVRSLKKTRQHT